MIKSKLLLLILFFLSANIYCQSVHNQTRISDDLYYTKICDSVYMYTHYFPYGCNGMLILLPDSKGVLIDTPCESTGTISLLNWIKENFGNIKLTAIVTGFHQDNLGGDEILLAKNIPVYGSDLTVQLLKDEGTGLKKFILNSVASEKNLKYYTSYKSLNLVPPDSIFKIKDGTNLLIGGETINVYFPGESHTEDNTVVYLKNRKILFGGCMVKGLEFDSPGYTGYANMVEWPISIEKVITKFPDVQIVIPGHGTEGGKELLPHMIEVLTQWKNEPRK